MDGLVNFMGSLSGSIEEGGGGGVTPHVTATASVNDETGTPSVTVIRSGPDSAPNFAFQFQNLKGERGQTGSQGIQGVPGPAGSPGSQGPRGFTGQTGATGPAGSDGYSPVVTISTLSDPDGHRITITDEQHPLGQSFDVMDGVDGSDGSQGPQGPQGNPGAGVAVGGTDGQILAKNGESDYQTRWINPTPNALPVISDEYDEHTAYSVGDYCIYQNTLYKCNTNISPYEIWDSTHWDACTVGEELTGVNSSLAQLDYFTLLNGEIVSNTKTTVTLFGNRKLSDYKFFIALVKINTVTRASMYVPKTALHQASDQLSLFYVDSANIQRWFEITYKSDTQVDIQSSANVTSSTAIYLYGYN